MLARSLLAVGVVVACGCGRLGFDDRAIPVDDGSPLADTPVDEALPPNSVTVTVDGNGRVVSDPAGLDCSGPGSCTTAFDVPVTFTAIGAAPDRFLGWDGTNCSTEASCVVIPSDTPIVFSARFTGRYNVAFTTSTAHPALGLTPATADGVCNDRARAVGLPGRYVALVSSGGMPAAARLGGADGWIAMDGLPITEFRTDLFGGAHRYSLRLDENQFNRPQIAWTGTDPLGNANGIDCDDWTSTAVVGSFGVADAVGGGFIFSGSITCTAMQNLYCAGIDHDAAPPVLRHSGRLAFVSTPWTPGGGLAAADAHCQANADGAGVAGNFKAFLAHSGGTGQSRFDLAKQTWVRRDGLRVFTRADQLGRPMLTPLNQRADASYSVELHAFTGDETRDCDDWTSTVGDVGGGQIQRSSYYVGTYGGNCGQSLPLFCFED